MIFFQLFCNTLSIEITNELLSSSGFRHPSVPAVVGAIMKIAFSTWHLSAVVLKYLNAFNLALNTPSLVHSKPRNKAENFVMCYSSGMLT